MGILDDVAAQISDVFDAEMLGRPATYSGTAISIVLTGKGQAAQGADPTVYTFDATALVQASQVAKPCRGDRVVISGVDYTVEAVTGGDAAGATWTIGLVADMGVTL
ncbi:hypothetical protein DDE01_12070 [Desulfovibrio desulfuricans]|nr:hypothetical protein DDE01_12070 [Desulfovibrio desulfuricans]